MTLIEMLIAAAITLILMIAVVQAFGTISKYISSGRATIELAGQLRSATGRLQSDLDGVTGRRRLDTADTRNDERVTAATREPRYGAENTRTGQLRAKGVPTQCVTWPRSRRGTPRRTAPAGRTGLATAASTLAPRWRTDPVKSHTHLQQVARCTHVHTRAGADGHG